ncbi:hypothetical protein ACP70R_050144 [Stipagrostis hirtigluma subsp. patula]
MKPSFLCHVHVVYAPDMYTAVKLHTMAISSMPELLISTLAVLVPFCLYMKSRRTKIFLHPMDWPVVGLLPSLIGNLHNLQEYVTGVLAASGGSFKAHGPQATSMRFFITCDPANIRHIFTTNHANYPKGEEFGEIFDIMSGSFFTVDGESCRRQRGRIQSILSNPSMVAVMASCSREKVAKGLLAFLTRMASTRTPFDLQDLITRFVFDLTAMPIFGVDPGLLSPGDMPPVDAAAAMDTVMEVGLFRHAVPASCWKAMRRLNVGPERKLATAHSVLHGFITEMMERRKASRADAVASVDILSSYIDDPEYNDDRLLRATLINYMIAGRDTIGTTLPWFFFNLAKNPHVIAGIRKELAPIVSRKRAGFVSGDGTGEMVVFRPEETKPLVYLQAALLESLRLYPPGPIERKTVVDDDVMPSGHEVRSGDAVLISLYALGRMETVWGKDCSEYRPERWISEDGTKLRYVPSHKFLAFNSGPRMCLGKDIAIMQMKLIVAAVIWNFDVVVLEGQSIEPKLSCILQMKNGLRVMVNKRED